MTPNQKFLIRFVIFVYLAVAGLYALALAVNNVALAGLYVFIATVSLVTGIAVLVTSPRSADHIMGREEEIVEDKAPPAKHLVALAKERSDQPPSVVKLTPLTLKRHQGVVSPELVEQVKAVIRNYHNKR